MAPLIRPISFVDTSVFTAHYIAKYRKEAKDGVLSLREIGEVEIEDCPVLEEWKSARALLIRVKNGAAPFFGGRVPELGRAWVETLPPGGTTPWTRDETADEFVRLRICLVPHPDAWSFCGPERAGLMVGAVTVFDHSQPCSEINLGDNARVHLIVDLRKPDDLSEEG